MVPRIAPSAPALPMSGTFFVINSLAPLGRIPFLIRLLLSSYFPNRASDRAVELLTITAPDPRTRPPRSPNPDPVNAAPASAPRLPAAATLGRSTLAALTISFPVFFRSL